VPLIRAGENGAAEDDDGRLSMDALVTVDRLVALTEGTGGGGFLEAETATGTRCEAELLTTIDGDLRAPASLRSLNSEMSSSRMEDDSSRRKMCSRFRMVICNMESACGKNDLHHVNHTLGKATYLSHQLVPLVRAFRRVVGSIATYQHHPVLDLHVPPMSCVHK
jgi:hypothetical protein